MSAFTTSELASLDKTDELRIAGLREDNTLRKATIIWMVVVDGELYVRSVNGPDAAWFRGTQLRGLGHVTARGVDREVSFTRVSDIDDQLDAAYAAKYRGYPSAVAAINSAAARSTTLRVDAA